MGQRVVWSRVFVVRVVDDMKVRQETNENINETNSEHNGREGGPIGVSKRNRRFDDGVSA